MIEFPDVPTILRKGGERLAKGGLTKGQLFEWQSGVTKLDNCKVCAFGALNWALTGHPGYIMSSVKLPQRDEAWELFGQAEMYLLNAIQSENPGWFERHRSGGVPDFNDDPATTHAQVVHVFNVAASNAARDAGIA